MTPSRMAAGLCTKPLLPMEELEMKMNALLVLVISWFLVSSALADSTKPIYVVRKVLGRQEEE